MVLLDVVDRLLLMLSNYLVAVHGIHEIKL